MLSVMNQEIQLTLIRCFHFFVGKNIALNKKYKGVKMILKAFKLCSNAHIYLQADI